ncbi:MAG TPA: type IV toxin-antitoxin system AbiEi family antitoxin domain-containing protein [Streptosporangiaceae bacterium]|nr:type IV toxin-antitoxin system AbiEi family antitoxin domain-containing protein [Streptosporangiaceae bacterium]
MTTNELPDSGRLAGILTTAELARAGITRSHLRILTGRGALVPLGRGLYAKAHLVSRLNSAKAGPPALRLAAAVAAAGPDAVGSHQHAALIHGLPLLTRPRTDLVDVTRPPGTSTSHSARPGTRVHAAAIPAGHRTVVSGIPVTTVARTVIDLARTTPVRDGVVTADSALHAKKTTKTELYAVIDACPRWPGIARARRVTDFSDGLAESPFESIARVAFHDAELPPPQLQAEVGGDGRVIARVDFYWPAHATIAEADGAGKYQDPGVARRQLQRDAELRAAGFQVVHFNWQEFHISPDQVIQAITAAFAQAARLARISG